MEYILDLIDIAAKKYPIKKLASEIDKRPNTLRNELNQNLDDYKLGFTTAIKIMQITGDLTAIDKIEEGFNRIAFSLPDPDPKNIVKLMELVARLSKEFGETVLEMTNAMHDGAVTAKEAEKSLVELMDLIRACVDLKAYLERLIELKKNGIKDRQL